MQKNQADAVALSALGWILEQEELCGAFLSNTGVASGDISKLAHDRDFLASVIDFLLTDDVMLMRFCDVFQLAYDTPMSARQSLPGGNHIHWT